MSRKQQRRRRRPGARLHRGKAGTPRMDDDFALWGVHLLMHVLASEAYSTDEAAELVVEFPTTFPALMVPVVVGQSCLRRVVDIAAAALRRAPASLRVRRSWIACAHMLGQPPSITQTDVQRVTRL